MLTSFFSSIQSTLVGPISFLGLIIANLSRQLLFVKNLTKTYDGKVVVDSVNFEIPKGKVLSLIGPNGAGKSTVMNKQLEGYILTGGYGSLRVGGEHLGTGREYPGDHHVDYL